MLTFILNHVAGVLARPKRLEIFKALNVLGVFKKTSSGGVFLGEFEHDDRKIELVATPKADRESIELKFEGERTCSFTIKAKEGLVSISEADVVSEEPAYEALRETLELCLSWRDEAELEYEALTESFTKSIEQFMLEHQVLTSPNTAMAEIPVLTGRLGEIVEQLSECTSKRALSHGKEYVIEQLGLLRVRVLVIAENHQENMNELGITSIQAVHRATGEIIEKSLPLLKDKQLLGVHRALESELTRFSKVVAKAKKDMMEHEQDQEEHGSQIKTGNNG